MKKFRIVFIIVIVITLVYCLSSCTKDEENEVSSQEVQIFLSSSDDEGGLKSASTTTSGELIQITEGDTIDQYNVRDINILLLAKDQYGNKLNGSWTVWLTDYEEKNLSGYYLSDQPNFDYENTNIIALKLSVLGLYRVNFNSENKKFSFLIRHLGIPGKVGDEIANSYVFRLEYNSFYGGQRSQRNVYTLYLKYGENEFVPTENLDPNKEEYFYALINTEYPLIKFKVSKCKYSSNYVKFSFFEDEARPDNGIYRVRFLSGENYESWPFMGMYLTSWKKEGYITFKPLN